MGVKPGGPIGPQGQEAATTVSCDIRTVFGSQVALADWGYLVLVGPPQDFVGGLGGTSLELAVHH